MGHWGAYSQREKPFSGIVAQNFLNGNTDVATARIGYGARNGKEKQEIKMAILDSGTNWRGVMSNANPETKETKTGSYDGFLYGECKGADEVIPDGKYNLVITGTEHKANAKGTGTNLRVQFRVEGPQYNGHKFFTYFVVTHDNDWAQKMGCKALFQMAEACCVDIQNADSPDVLIGQRVKATVYTDYPKDPKYKAQNRAKNFERADPYHGLYD